MNNDENQSDQDSLDDLFSDQDILDKSEFVSSETLEELDKPHLSSGIDILINAAVAYERLPMLEIVFDRFVRFLVTSLRNFTSDNVDVVLDSMNSTRFETVLDKVSVPSMLPVFRANEWDNQGLIVIDPQLSYSIIDVLMGGRHTGSTILNFEGRTYTTIERSLIKRLSEILLIDLSMAFEPITSISFGFERLENNPRFAMITRPSSSILWIRLRVSMEERGGNLDLILPYATIEPIRKLLLQNYMGEKFGRDSFWESHLADELWRTEIPLEAKFSAEFYSLGEILEWKEGSQILLNRSPQTEIDISSGSQTLFKGKMGQKTGHLCVKICENFLENKEDINAPIR